MVESNFSHDGFTADFIVLVEGFQVIVIRSIIKIDVKKKR